MFVSLFSCMCRPIAGVVNLCPNLENEQDIDNLVLTVSHELTHAFVCVFVFVCVCVCVCVFLNLTTIIEPPPSHSCNQHLHFHIQLPPHSKLFNCKWSICTNGLKKEHLQCKLQSATTTTHVESARVRTTTGIRSVPQGQGAKVKVQRPGPASVQVGAGGSNKM